MMQDWIHKRLEHRGKLNISVDTQP